MKRREKRSSNSLRSGSLRLCWLGFCSETHSSRGTLLRRFRSWSLLRFGFGNHNSVQNNIRIGIFWGIDCDGLGFGSALPLLCPLFLFCLLGSFLDPYLTEFEDSPGEVFSASAD
jgi:hypothetical protein